MLRYRRCLVIAALVALAAGPAIAVPLSGVTYHYSPALLPDPNDGNGEWTWNSAATTKDLTETKLTDGILGTTVILPSDTVAFVNGTWSGYNNDTAFEGHPRVDLDLGGLQQVQSVEVQYLIETPPYVFAPQSCPGSDPNCFGGVDALTVSGSTDGISFSPLGVDNAFEPVYGPNGSFALNTVAARTSVIDFGPGGVAASHLQVDVRTLYTWIFLGEITVNAVPEPATFLLLSSIMLGWLSFVRRR